MSKKTEQGIYTGDKQAYECIFNIICVAWEI